MDKYICLKESGIQIGGGDDGSSSDDSQDDDDDDDDDSDGDEGEDEGGRYSEGEGEDENEDEDSQPKGGLTPEAIIGIGDIHAGGIVPNNKAYSHYSSATFIFLIRSNLQDDLRSKASAFMGVAKDTTRSPEDIISTPLPGETLAMFYARSSKSGVLHSRNPTTPFYLFAHRGVLVSESPRDK